MTDRADLAAASRALSEGATFRGVRRARLRLPDREAQFGVRAALEDALRTADFGDAGRLIVVRSLRLVALPRGVSGPQLARALERAWRTLAPSAVAAEAPGAGNAEVVYFRSPHAARLAWLERFARAGAPDEWFWPRALPELGGGSALDALVPMLAALQADAPHALARTIVALPAAAIRRVLAALPAARVAALLPLADAQGHGLPGTIGEAPVPAPQDTGAPPAEESVTPGASGPRTAVQLLLRDAGLRGRLAVLSSSFAPSDWRIAWFAAQALHAERGGAVQPGEVAALLGAVSPHPEAVAAIDADSPRLPPEPAAPHEPPAARAPAASSPAPARPHAVARLDDGLPAARRAHEGGRRPRDPWLEDDEPTAFGGLLMLVNALQALRFGAWLEAQAAPVRAHFARALLARIARRLRVPPDDPHWRLLALDENGQRALREAPCRWEGFRWPAGFDAGHLLPASPVVSAGESLRRWRCALSRLLRRHAGVGLARVAWRAAGMSLTPTHVDVIFPLAAADAVLRRTGLDRDPGWVPWLGRIVAFHYLEAARDGIG